MNFHIFTDHDIARIVYKTEMLSYSRMRGRPPG